MNTAVYVLSSATALVCMLLLLRGYFQARVRLLLWCALFFFGLTIENALMVVESVMTIDTVWPRRSAALLGIITLLLGVIFDSK